MISLEIRPAVEGSVTDVLSEGDLGLVTGECCMDVKTGQRTEAWGRAFPAPERNSLPQFPSTLVSGSRLLDLWDSRFLLSRFVMVTLTKLQYWFYRETMASLCTEQKRRGSRICSKKGYAQLILMCFWGNRRWHRSRPSMGEQLTILLRIFTMFWSSL